VIIFCSDILFYQRLVDVPSIISSLWAVIIFSLLEKEKYGIYGTYGKNRFLTELSIYNFHFVFKKFS